MLILFHYVLSGNQLGMTQTANSDSQASTQTQFIPFSLSWVASSLHLTCVVLGSAKDLGLPPSGSSFLDFPSHFPEALVALTLSSKIPLSVRLQVFFGVLASPHNVNCTNH